MQETQEKEMTYKTDAKQGNGNMNIYINTYFKCKWIKHYKQKKNWLMERKPRTINMLFTRVPFQTKRHIQTGSKMI